MLLILCGHAGHCVAIGHYAQSVACVCWGHTDALIIGIEIESTGTRCADVGVVDGACVTGGPNAVRAGARVGCGCRRKRVS